MSRLLAIIALALLAAPSARGQFYFGKNKVQYTEFDWHVMETDHFKVYFYTAEQEVAGVAAAIAEDAYRELAARFNHEIAEQVPVIIYSSPSYFSQTNVIPNLVPESVGGFTEFMKGRVVVPFHGSYHDFRHVIRHELVHVFMLSRIDAALERNPRMRWSFPPLWFTEGLAEFWSKEWDAEGDMIVKDMVINGRLFSIPRFYRLQGSYFMYKLGESVCQFIDSTYGSDKLTRMFDNWPKGRSFEDVVKITLGDNLEEVSRKWEYALKKKYYPQLQHLDLPQMESEQITFDGLSAKGVPIRWDDGSGSRDYVVFKANRMGYTGLYLKPADAGKKGLKTLVKGERSADFESLYLLRSGLDATDSGLIVFSSKSKDRDVIYLYDLNQDRVTTRYEFDSVVAALSPRFSPDGASVVFSGVEKSGFTDLYLLDLRSGDYRRLTNDIYYDADPTFAPGGDRVVFASDRGAMGPQGALNLFELDIGSGRVEQMTFGPYRDGSPDYTEHGVYFASDRGGTFNVFLLDDNGDLTRQSTYVTGALNPRLSSDGETLMYTGYQNMSFQIYQMDLKPSAEPFSQTEPMQAAGGWTPSGIDGATARSSVRYDAEFSLDIAQSAIGYDPVYGSIGGIQVAVSDMLGDRAYYFLITNTARTKDDFLESFNLGVTYVNRENRLNWGVGAFHLFNEYFNDYDGYFYERQAGVISLLSYPMSKFFRIDLTSLANYSKRDLSFGYTLREVFLFSNYLSLVYDNSLWDISGPIEGRRYNLTAGWSAAVDEKEINSRTVLADLRHYFRLGKYSAFANRLFGYTSAGIEPERIYFGGSWSFRGYDRRAFYNRNVVFASNELRFPLIDNLLIGSPIGGFGFSAIRGALFFDVGSAWDDDFDRLLGSLGGGFRVALGYLVVLRFDFTRTTDFESISRTTDFDFFFGWNF